MIQQTASELSQFRDLLTSVLLKLGYSVQVFQQIHANNNYSVPSGVANYSLKHLHGITMFVRAASCISAFRTKPHNSLSSTRYQRHLFHRHENMCRAAISVGRSDTKYQSLYLLLPSCNFVVLLRNCKVLPTKGCRGKLWPSIAAYVCECKSRTRKFIKFHCFILLNISPYNTVNTYPIVRDTGDFVQQLLPRILRFDLSAWHPLLLFTEKLHQRTNIPGNSCLGMQIVGPMWNQYSPNVIIN